MSTLLDLRDVHAYYGKIHAIKGVSLHVDAGEIVSLIGANGAGKTTILRAVCGILRPSPGEIWLDGGRIDGLPSHRIAPLGVALVPEGRRVFPRLSVEENLLTGTFSLGRRNDPSSDFDRVYGLFPKLRDRRGQAAGTLSGGEQQMLAVGRALMAHPRVLLMDEPSMGLAPIVVEQIFETIASINREGTTIMLVEQNAMLALETAARGYVLQSGAINLEGTSADLLASDEVRRLYLGEEPLPAANPLPPCERAAVADSEPSAVRPGLASQPAAPS